MSLYGEPSSVSRLGRPPASPALPHERYYLVIDYNNYRSRVSPAQAVARVAVEGPDGPFEARAGGGVVLATGGFEHDAKLVRTFLRGPLARAVSVPTNTGDALRMAMRVGADLADMREAWWVATIDVEVPGRGLVPWQVNSERTRPHSIMVNDDGVRFTNEAANYNALGNAFHVVDVARFAYVNHPAWLLIDHHFASRYGLAGYSRRPARGGPGGGLRFRQARVTSRRPPGTARSTSRR